MLKCTLRVCTRAGSLLQEEVKPEERKGLLWDFYRSLVADGWTPDVYSYTTSFRCPAEPFHLRPSAVDM